MSGAVILMLMAGAVALWQPASPSRDEVARISRIFRDVRRLPAAEPSRPRAQGSAADVAGLSGAGERDELAQRQLQRRAAEAETARVVEQKRAEDDARKVSEQKRLASEAEAVRVAEQKRAEDDARKLAEQKRLASEAEAVRVAEQKRAEDDARKVAEQKRLAAEAEAVRVAEQKRAEDDARKVAEQKRLAAAEAEAVRVAEQKRTEEEARMVAVQKRAEEDARTVAGPKRSSDVAVASAATVLQSPVSPGASGCGVAEVTAEPLPAGQSRIAVSSPCRKSEPILLSYGPFAMTRPLDASGQAAIVLDVLFPQSTPVIVDFSDGQSRSVAAAGRDGDAVTKVAVVWQGPADLNLHAFEFAALPDEPGHVWSGARSGLKEALGRARDDGRGHGFLTSLGEPGASGGRMQVYTFVHAADAAAGLVAMRLDYASRGERPAGDFCGSGKFSTVAFDVVIRSNTGETRQEHTVIPSANCGVKLDLATRLLGGAVPDIRLRN